MLVESGNFVRGMVQRPETGGGFVHGTVQRPETGGGFVHGTVQRPETGNQGCGCPNPAEAGLPSLAGGWTGGALIGVAALALFACWLLKK